MFRAAAPGAVFFCMALAGHPAHAEYAGMNYYIERPRLAADLLYRMESYENETPDVSTQTTTRTLSERFDIESGGFIYHPALMTFKLRLSPEWQQEMDEYDPGSNQRSDTFLLGYSVDMTFLESKPYSLDVFARRQLSTLTTSIATTSDTESEAYGATLRLKYPVLPTTLALAHSTTDQSGFFVSNEIRDEALLNMRHTRPSNDTTLNAIWRTTDRTAQGSTVNTENLFGILQNLYRITPDSRVLLNSSLTYRDSKSDVSGASGDVFKSSGIDLSENLTWRHSNTFSTHYSLLVGQDQSESSSFVRDVVTTVDRASVMAGLTHSLYENLITTSYVSASTSSIGEDDYGGAINFSYQRGIPWGTIYASLGQDYRVTNRSYDVSYIQVLNEAHVLRTGDITLLDNLNVDLSTVVVTSADASIVYALDFDYTLERIGKSVRISRTSFGAIPNGGSVLVSYQYLSNPAYDSSSYGQSYGLGFYLWSAWRTNYLYTRSQEDFISGIPPDTLADDTRHLLTSDLTWKWSTTRLLYEDIESTTGVSSTRWLVEESLLFRPRERVFLNLSGYVGHTTFKDFGSAEDLFGGRAEVQWRVTNWSRARVEGFYEETDGTSTKIKNIGALALWEWSYGIWTGEASYRYLNQQDFTSDQTINRNSVFFSIRRTLF